MKKLQASLLLDHKSILAEGIQWNPQHERLYWTDIHGRAFHSCDHDGQNHRMVMLPSRLSAFAFTNKPDILLAAFEDGLYHFNLKNHHRDMLMACPPPADKQGVLRFNDGRCDRNGRFLIGTVEEVSLANVGALMVYAPDRQNILMNLIGCSNGLAFNRAGTKLYHTDSPSQTIMRYPYDCDAGAVFKAGKIFTKIEGDCVADGACIDDQDCLWTAIFNGGQVRRYSEQGALDMVVEVPTSQVTCCAIGGISMNRLYISTAFEGFSGMQHREQPLAGCIFYVDLPDGIGGIAEARAAL
ncbi:MAG: SMP-30/gluconolactonase/LRE family protein [Alphaproteobacteria bacterium]